MVVVVVHRITPLPSAQHEERTPPLLLHKPTAHCNKSRDPVDLLDKFRLCQVPPGIAAACGSLLAYFPAKNGANNYLKLLLNCSRIASHHVLGV